jgi:hypothetical protein
MKRAPVLTRSFAIAACAGLALTVSQPVLADEDAGELTEAMTKGEKRLAKLLEGRVAGEPQRCIRTFPNDRFEAIDKTAYVYGRGDTIYVQRTTSPESIDDNEALVTRRFNATQVCRMDIAQTIDPFIGLFTGGVIFEDFIPYTRVEKTGG